MSPFAAAILTWGFVTAALISRPHEQFKPETYAAAVFAAWLILVVLTILAVIGGLT